MRALIVIPAFLILAACQTASQQPLLTTERITVVTPPESMYYCPTVAVYPSPDQLTDVETAKLMVQLHKNNRICKNSMNSIKRYLDQAKKTAEAQ